MERDMLPYLVNLNIYQEGDDRALVLVKAESSGHLVFQIDTSLYFSDALCDAEGLSKGQIYITIKSGDTDLSTSVTAVPPEVTHFMKTSYWVRLISYPLDTKTLSVDFAWNALGNNDLNDGEVFFHTVIPVDLGGALGE